MKKKIKKYGNGLVIHFTKEEVELYGLREGDVIELDDMFIQKQNKKKQKNEN